LPGWEADITYARTLDDLPKQARDYVACVEELAGIPAAWISVGPERHQTIHRQA
jgi:adenylosuccinate synthase